MDIKIEFLKNNDGYLNQVIKLADSNKKELGFLPREIFKQSAKKKKIIVAIDESTKTVIGYLLFRTSDRKHKVAIVHLCVEQNYRKSGIAKQLVEFLKNNSNDWLGIGLYSRRDFSSHNLWPKLGFHITYEKTGRSKKGSQLSYYWLQNPNNLLTLAESQENKSKPYLAVIDANVFIDIADNPDHFLLSKQLFPDLQFEVTSELSTEVNRDENNARRKKRLIQISSSYVVVNSNKSEEDKIFELLKAENSNNLSVRDTSDIRQLAQAIVAKANFFVTKDGKAIKRYARIVNEQFGLIIVKPENLACFFDELTNKSENQSYRFSGANYYQSKVKFDEFESLVNVFYNGQHEKKKSFEKKVGDLIKNPTINSYYVIKSPSSDPVALFILSKMEQGLDVPILRVKHTSMEDSLFSQLIFGLIRETSAQKLQLISVSEQELSERASKILTSCGFYFSQNKYLKININGIYSTDELLENIINLQSLSPSIEFISKEVFNFLRKTDLSAAEYTKIEKIFWPLKISNAQIDSFIIPIKPVWAMDLFDHQLGNQTLLGSNPEKIFQFQNVYYRSPNKPFPTTNSRIIWYTTQGSGFDPTTTKCINACSYNNRTIIDSPQRLFRQFSNLGVYKWDNVFKIAEKNNNKVLTFFFSHTELFARNITLDEYMNISARNVAPLSPIRISNREFLDLYSLGQNIRKIP
jgi:predicted nucleic acid-binding protein/ribosomal protein S18 acetylase RimI-like enzyme